MKKVAKSLAMVSWKFRLSVFLDAQSSMGILSVITMVHALPAIELNVFSFICVVSVIVHLS